MGAITLETHDYINTHGHGYLGRGGWAFATSPNADVTNTTHDHFASGALTYSEANKLTCALAKANGHGSDGATHSAHYRPLSGSRLGRTRKGDVWRNGHRR